MLVSLVLRKGEVGITGMCVSNEREVDERKVDERKVMIRSGTGRSSNERSKVVTVAPINTTNSSIPLSRRSLPDYRECVYMCVHARAALSLLLSHRQK